MSDHIHYNPAQIGDALAQIEANRRVFEEGSQRVQAAYERLQGASSGASITAAIDAQNQARGLREETNANINSVKVAGQASLDRVQGDDARFASILG
jgi:hypothetical protein